MHTIVKIAGGLTAFVGLVICFFGFRMAADSSSGLGGLWVIGIGLSTILSGAILYCFGAIVDHLAAIRDYQRRQVDIVERRPSTF